MLIHISSIIVIIFAQQGECKQTTLPLRETHRREAPSCPTLFALRLRPQPRRPGPPYVVRGGHASARGQTHSPTATCILGGGHAPSPGEKTRRPGRKYVVRVSAAASSGAAAAAAVSAYSSQFSYDENIAKYAGRLEAPPALPPVPRTASLVDVMPYLFRIAISDAKMWWRMWLAGLLLVISKVTGV